MWTFMTTGTLDYLEKFPVRYPATDFKLMNSSATTLIYYEDTKRENHFAAGKEYQHLYTYQNIREFGFIVMKRIPVLHESKPVFESTFATNQHHLEQVSTLLSARLMKENNENNYIFLTQWINEKDYNDWVQSKEFETSFFAKMTRTSAYFASRPFKHSYHLIQDEDVD